MKKNILILSTFLLSTSIFAQVGINTTNPKATLDITALPTDLTRTDGIIIPRIDGNQLFLKNNLYGADQTATLIYVTSPATGASLAGDTEEVTETGYYMHNGIKWIKLNASTSVSSNDWQLSGNTTTLTHFIGTLNDQPLNFKINNEKAGLIEKYNLSYGYLSLSSNTGVANSAFGSSALSANTTGSNNSAFGYYALSENTTGSANSAFGIRSLLSNTTGVNNSSFGTNVLFRNTTGGYNSAFGTDALYSNTTGGSNNAFGSQALANNNTGNSNNAFGIVALARNTTGSSNNAFGNSALTNNTTGNYNIAVGNNALEKNIIGSFNNAIGQLSLVFNTADNNNAFGYHALFNNETGTHNVGMGNEALGTNQTGSYNTAIGNAALQYNRGDYNTAIGYQAGVPNYNVYTNTTAIGSKALVTASNSIVLGGSAGSYEVNVGINTTAPQAKLHIIKNASQLTPAIIEGCNVYADNAAAVAAGLPSGALYRTAAGVLMIRY